MKILNPAFANFTDFMCDIKDLSSIHDALQSKRKTTGGGTFRRGKNIEVLRRAMLILLVTAWETFVEDFLSHEFMARLDSATSPKELEGTVNSVASAWIEERRRNDKSISVPDLLLWSGDGWKELARNKFKSEIRKLNSPNSKNIQALFKRYLAVADVTQAWATEEMPHEDVQTKLDDLIKLRGELVHRGEQYQSRRVVSPDQANEAKNLIEHLVASTGKLLGRSEWEPFEPAKKD